MSNEEARIGVFICDCGSNIAGVVDTQAVTDYAATLPHVVYVKRNKYTCADPGQLEIKDAIDEHKLNRVVVASCSPRLHEPTFRRTCEDAGLNPYLFEMANIREHVSWVHGEYPEEATTKAKDMVAMAVAKAAYLHALEKTTVPVTKRALIVGGGISGISASLDLADQGYEVILVEKSPSIGGVMAKLDKTFPTLDCSICIEGPMMSDVGKHSNITLYTMSELEEISGYIGNFKAKIRHNPRYIIENKCNGCGDCSEVCPVTVPHEFDEGLGPRKAIYLPFPQAVPMKYVLDKDACIECKKCIGACGEKEAIDLDMQPEVIEAEIGVIIIAAGYALYDPHGMPSLGYGRYPNVITALELERLVNASGPTLGKVIGPDGKKPKHVTFLTCVGSRDVNANIWCSGFCCMYTIKNALLLKEKYKDAIDVSILSMDIRTNFKDYEEFYQRARQNKIRFIRGRAPEVQRDPLTNHLIVPVEAGGQLHQIETDLVVLANAAVPIPDSEQLGQVLNLSRSPSGFYLEAHPKLKPVDTATAGLFVAGSAQGPKDIPYSVAQGLAAASRAARILSQERWTIESIVSYMAYPERCTKCKRCTKVCPYNAVSWEEETKEIVINPALCQGCGNCVAECPTGALDQKHFTDRQIIEQIRTALKENPEEKILTFACNWCSYGGSDTAGVSRMQMKTPARVIRTMCSGRISQRFVQEAFRLGAGMVLVSGCHINDCHYINANFSTEKRFKNFDKRLQSMGISPERFKLEWVSASEGEKWQATINSMAAILDQMDKEKIKQETVAAQPNLLKGLKRLHEKLGEKHD
ncbi:MAG: hydrogenase iron-sulfur subunit [Candidatus Hodarchaeota archaeon]